MNISQIRQKSLITAIKTPFDSKGKIDLVAFDYLVEQQIKHGVEGLIIGGTTGEGHLLDWQEHLMLIAHAVNRYADQLVIIGNTGSNNTREAIKATQYGFASGMHASLLINPYYGKTSLQGVQKHLQAGLELGPAFIYNVSARTGQDIPPSVIKSLADHGNFVGVKECQGNQRIAEYESQGIACWSGNDDQAFEARHQCKAHGVISVTSNIVPGLMRKLMDSPHAQSLNQSLLPLFNWLFELPNPIAINTALAMTGAIQPVFRLPYCPLEKKQREQGMKILSALDSLDRVGNHLNLLDDSDFQVVV